MMLGAAGQTIEGGLFTPLALPLSRHAADNGHKLCALSPLIDTKANWMQL